MNRAIQLSIGFALFVVAATAPIQFVLGKSIVGTSVGSVGPETWVSVVSAIGAVLAATSAHRQAVEVAHSRRADHLLPLVRDTAALLVDVDRHLERQRQRGEPQPERFELTYRSEVAAEQFSLLCQPKLHLRMMLMADGLERGTDWPTEDWVALRREVNRLGAELLA